MNRKNLASYITLMITSLLGILLIVGAVVILVVKKNDIEKENAAAIKANLEFISTSISEPLYTYNQNSLESILKSFILVWRHSFLGVRIIDLDHREVIREYSNKVLIDDYNSYFDSHKNEISELDIKYENKIIGKLQLIPDHHYYQDQYRQWRTWIVIYTIFAILILYIFFYSALHRLISRPLNKLVNEIIKLRKNDYSAKVEGVFKYELMTIAEDFNKAIEGIKNRDDKIKEYANSLEDIVKKRTFERDEQTLKAINAARLASVGEMSAGIAHEINNPLAVISGLSQHIIRSLEKKGESFGDEIDRLVKIKSMVQRIQKIIEGIKKFSRDGSKEDFSEFSLEEFLSSVVELTNFKMVTSAIDFKIITKTEIKTIRAQEIQLSQVIINLLNNSVDAIGSHDGEKWITLEVYDQNNCIYFAITDSGNGIPFELQNKILQPFFTTKEKGKGTGLGLSLSVGIMKDHHGELFYDSKSEKTKFVLYIPVNIRGS
jgi:signal transduction histidine kinase